LTLPPTFDPVPAPSATELNNAFDDPAHGEPGRDRFRVHAIWEVVLLIAVAGMVIAVNEKSHLDGVGIRGILALVAVYAMFGVGAGWSLRAGAVNLALGPIAVSSGLYFAQQHQHHRAYLAVLMALGIAAGIGVLIALVVALLQVPGWAVSLAAFLGVDVWITHLPASVKVSGTPDIVAHAYYVFAVVAAVAIVGAAIGAVRPVRRAVGRFRPVSDPADRRGAPGAWMAAIGLVGSSVIAAGAGILYVMTTRTATTDSGLTWSVAAVAVALVGGTSLFGRRGGVLGTVLAAALFVLVTQYANLADYRVDPRALAGGALIVGVLVTRLIETYGRPRRSYIDEASTTGWLGGGVAGWANPAESHGTSSTGTEPPGLPERPRTEWVDPNDEAWGVR
jgi:ribose/xylose/arabinose/galactoside ABC-type transport system permease subunit